MCIRDRTYRSASRRIGRGLLVGLLLLVLLGQGATVRAASGALTPDPDQICRGDGLSATLTWYRDGSAIAGIIHLIVTPDAPCTLTDAPGIALFTADGAPIIAIPPTKQPSYSALPLSSGGGGDSGGGINSGGGADIRFRWENWCAAPPPTPLTILLLLPGAVGTVRVEPTGSVKEDGPLDATPRCTDLAQPSWLFVTRFSPAAPGRYVGTPDGSIIYVGPYILTYWRTHGEVALLGYPISVELGERLADEKVHRVQYFERARLEYHPENAAPNDVLLGQLGRALHPAEPPVPARSDGLSRYFPETGHNVDKRFLGFWQANGGLAQFGYPLGEASDETLADGNTYRVQYFERARFEYHPEHDAPYDVQLGQLGRAVHPIDPPAASLPAAAYFPQTGHNLHTGFRDFWEAHGGLAQFGYPLTEEVTEVSATEGKEYTVQYFERARFEWHPENPPDYRVLLGQLGRQVYTVRAEPPVPQSPASGYCPAAAGTEATVRAVRSFTSPRCQQVQPGQHLRIVNNTDQPVRAQLAYIDVTIAPGDGWADGRPFGTHLAPGVHSLALSAYAGGGAELWLQP